MGDTLPRTPVSPQSSWWHSPPHARLPPIQPVTLSPHTRSPQSSCPPAASSSAASIRERIQRPVSLDDTVLPCPPDY